MEDGDPTSRVRPPAAPDHEPAPLSYIPAPRSPQSVPSTRPAVTGVQAISYRGKCGAGVQPCGLPARFYPARSQLCPLLTDRCRPGPEYQDPDHFRTGPRKSLTRKRFPRSAWVQVLNHQQTKNLLVSYSPKRLGFF